MATPTQGVVTVLNTPLQGLIHCSNDEYHAAPGMSKSKLDAIAISPLNYWDQHINPDREPREYKHCFAVGDGTHKLVLEPGTFEETYAVGFDKSAHPDALDTMADMKAELAKLKQPVSGSKPELAARLVEAGFPADRILLNLEAAHNQTMTGKVPMPAGDYKHMMAMLRAVNSHHTAAGLLRGAFTEQSFFTTTEEVAIDPVTGAPMPTEVLRKCRLDALSANGAILLDLKTTDDVSQSAFDKTISQRRYHVQAAWYLDILKLLYGKEAPTHFAFIAVQKRRPYDVAVHFVTEDHLSLGRYLYRRDLDQYLRCQLTNQWPGVDAGQIIESRLTSWDLRLLKELEDADKA